MEIKLKTINQIKPDKSQPRRTFDKESIAGLAETIKKHGLLQPIDIDQNNVITFGERRWRACKKAGLKKVPVIVRVVDKATKLERQLVEDCTDEAIPIIERDVAWWKLYKLKYPKEAKVFALRSKRQTNKDFKLTEFGKLVGRSTVVVSQAFDRLELGKSFSINLTPSTITETRHLDSKDRLKLLKTAEKQDIGSRKIREYVSAVKKLEAHPHLKEDVLKGKLEPQVALREAEEQFNEEETLYPMEEGGKEGFFLRRFKSLVNEWTDKLIELRSLDVKYLPAPEIEIMISFLKEVQKEEAKAYKTLIAFRKVKK